jgi:CBS domain-containing protein
MPLSKISVYEDASILEANKIIIIERIDLIPVVTKEDPTKIVGAVTGEAIANAYDQARKR